MTNRKYQAQETKCKIITKSLELFHSNSFDDITVDMICAACGLSKGAFYHHFSSKEELMLQHFLQLLDCRIINEIEPQINTLSTMELIDRFVDMIISFVLEVKAEWMIFCLKAILNNPSQYNVEHFQEDFVMIFTTGVERGEIEFKYPLDYCLEYIYSVIFGFFIRWCIRGGNTDDLSTLKNYVHMAIDACSKT